MGDIFKRLTDLARSEFTNLTQGDREFNQEFLDYFKKQPEFEAYRSTFDETYGDQSSQQSQGRSEQSRHQSRQSSEPEGGLKYDPYGTLEISRNASLDDIEKAYRKMARKYHPDRFQTEKERELATKIMSSINASYTFLKKKHKS